MNKWGNIVCVAGLLACFLFGCKGQTEAVETTAPPTEPPIMLTEQELYKKFELVYDDCGASSSEDAEQIAKELSALNKKATADTKEWPESYETQYKTWRANTIKERAETVAAEYEQIIAEQTLYEIGVEGLWETRPGLIYADYIDIEKDGKQELILLSWAANDDGGAVATIEAYGDQKGHAVKCFEQVLDLSLGIAGASVSLAENADGATFVGITAEDGGSGQNTKMSVFYTLEGTGLSVADVVFDHWERDYSADNMDGATAYSTLKLDNLSIPDENPNAYFWSSSWNLETSDLGEELTEEQYTALLAKYNGKPLFHMPGNLVPQIYETGILPAFEVAVPHIEVNGEVLELSAAPYASGGVFMAPLRDVLEAIGITVYANSDASVILASTKKDTLVIASGDFSLDRNGIEGAWRRSNNWYYCFNGGDQSQTEVGRSNGVTFVPIQEIAGLFGANCQWDSVTKTMKIAGTIPDSDRMSQENLKAIANFNLDEAIKIAEQNGYSYYFTTASGGTPDGEYVDDSFYGGNSFRNGKSIWEFFIDGGKEITDYGGIQTMIGAEAKSDGTFRVNPEMTVLNYWSNGGQE